MPGHYRIGPAQAGLISLGAYDGGGDGDGGGGDDGGGDFCDDDGGDGDGGTTTSRDGGDGDDDGRDGGGGDDGRKRASRQLRLISMICRGELYCVL